MLNSVPLWYSSAYYSLSDGKHYCIYPFFDRSQSGASIACVIHIVACLVIIIYFYFIIYRFYRLAGRKRHVTANKKDSVLQSHVFTGESQKKDADNELRVLLTTALLIGWTFIGN